MIDMNILLGLQVETKIVDNQLEFKVSHNEHDTRVQVLSRAQFWELINLCGLPFSDHHPEEPSNRLYVSGLNGYCIFENSSKKDIAEFEKYVVRDDKMCHPALDIVLMIDIEDCLA